MDVRYSKRFQKQFKKLPHPIQIKADKTIKTFSRKPFTITLKNHALRGEFKGERAISVTSNVRIVFEEENNYKKVTFIRVGTHNQVY